MTTVPSNFADPTLSSQSGTRHARLAKDTLRYVVNNRATTPQPGTLAALAKEAEDAQLTGGTRSLDRRLLALNLAGSIARIGVRAERLTTSPKPKVA